MNNLPHTTASRLLLLLTAISAASLWSCLPGNPPQSLTALPADNPLVSAGAEYYAEYCIRCHGDGSGDHINPPLKNAKILQDQNALADVIINGRAGVYTPYSLMPAMPEITDEEAVALIAYLRQAFGELSTEEAAAANAVAQARGHSATNGT